MNDPLRAEVEGLERQGWDALSGPGGAAFYEDIMAEEGLMVFPGMVMDKKASLGTIPQVAPWSSYELSAVRVTGDDDVALITYKAVGERPGQARYEAAMSSVYVRRNGEWKLLLHQQSP